MSVEPEKMQGPVGVKSATIDGHGYDVDEKGQVKVAVQAHVEILRRHGFTDVVKSEETADDLKLMDREALTEYIEERGGEVKTDIKMTKLRIQALTAGGFTKEAEKLAKK